MLVQLDKEPYQVQVSLKRAAVRVAEANLTSAEAQARGLEAQLVSQRWKLQNASEQVNAQVALLRSLVAALRNSEAKRDLAHADYQRGLKLVDTHAMSREEFDTRHPPLTCAAPQSGSPACCEPKGEASVRRWPRLLSSGGNSFICPAWTTGWDRLTLTFGSFW